MHVAAQEEEEDTDTEEEMDEEERGRLGRSGHAHSEERLRR